MIIKKDEVVPAGKTPKIGCKLTIAFTPLGQLKVDEYIEAHPGMGLDLGAAEIEREDCIIVHDQDCPCRQPLQ